MHVAIEAVLCSLVGNAAVALYVIGASFAATAARPSRRTATDSRLREDAVPHHLFSSFRGGGPAASWMNGQLSD
jgi:hypothetical protein